MRHNVLKLKIEKERGKGKRVIINFQIAANQMWTFTYLNYIKLHKSHICSELFLFFICFQ